MQTDRHLGHSSDFQTVTKYYNLMETVCWKLLLSIAESKLSSMKNFALFQDLGEI